MKWMERWWGWLRQSLKRDRKSSQPAPTIEESVARPVITPAGGDETGLGDVENITITCATVGASGYVTQDGSAPTEASTAYTTPFTVTEPVGGGDITVRSKWFKAGLLPSAIAGETYHWDAPAPEPPEWLSHPPLYTLPVASDREIDESSPAYFIAPADHPTAPGNDSNNGTSESTPKLTIPAIQAIMSPGDTLFVRGAAEFLGTGGILWVTPVNASNAVITGHNIWSLSGTLADPIVLRSYPGEVACLAARYRIFYEDPDLAWTQDGLAAAGGRPDLGEFWSTSAYPIPITPPIAGNFGDSMIPLYRYQYWNDLRSTNETDFLPTSGLDPTGIYLGPGVFYNSATGRIHCRLSHTNIPFLTDTDHVGSGIDNNYAGVEDPREIPLLIGPLSTGLRLEGEHIHLQDLVIMGGQKSLEMTDLDGGGMEVDGCHLYAGAGFQGTIYRGADLTVTNTKHRGFSAPWVSRYHDKNRTSRGTLVLFAATTVRASYNEFTNHHDCFALQFVETLEFHHNTIHHINDDVFTLNPRHATQRREIWQNAFLGGTSILSFGGGGQGVIAGPNAGVFVMRNLFDMRRLTYDSPTTGFRGALLTNEHDPSVRPDIKFFHNTAAVDDDQHRDYMLEWTRDCEEAYREVYNNIVVTAPNAPRQGINASATVLTFKSQNNLQWGYELGSSAGAQPGDIHADPLFVAFAADWHVAADWHLQAGSPAILAGYLVPSVWPDPLRNLDSAPATPTIGAVPYIAADTTEYFGHLAEV